MYDIVYDIVIIAAPHKYYCCQALFLNLLIYQAMPRTILLGTATMIVIFRTSGSLNLLVCFLSDIQDWKSLDKSTLDHALQGVPVPI